jgi:hypothetical protein
MFRGLCDGLATGYGEYSQTRGVMNNVQEVIDYYYFYYGLLVSSVRSVQLLPDTLDGEGSLPLPNPHLGSPVK